MLSLVRQFVRLLTGKVDASEFALGIFFGVMLAMVPTREVDPATGFLGWNGAWLTLLAACLVLRASLPMTLVTALLVEPLERLALGRASFEVGRTLLDDVLPQAFGAGAAVRLPSWQLHTYWGLGSLVLGLALALPLSLGALFVLRRHLPAWRERLGRNRLVRLLGSSFLFRPIKWLLR